MRYVVLVAAVFAAVAIADGQTVLCSSNSTWRYVDNGSDQGTAWRGGGFNDSNWPGGPAPLGFGLSPLGTTIASGHITYYFRHSFNNPAGSAYSNLVVYLRRDDGGIVYLNGTEVFRSNMPTGTVSFATNASTTVSGAAQSAFFSTNISPSLLVAGANQLAVEIHQVTASSVDVVFDLALVGNACFAPVITNQPQSTSASGGTVTLTAGASGTGPLSYQWLTNGIAMPGATNTDFTIANFQLSNAANYSVVASNACGQVTSQVARVSFLSLDIYPGLLFGGPTGAMYQIEYTLDVAPSTNWTVLTNIVLPMNPYLWTDPTPARAPRRFYRAVPLP